MVPAILWRERRLQSRDAGAPIYPAMTSPAGADASPNQINEVAFTRFNDETQRGAIATRLSIGWRIHG
jgi:hypothetical protein